jgi:tRNA pseudouridine32 synthase/23S rRNA pseudouridine746 synthase
MPLETLFRDNRFAIINKPAGLAVHAGPRGGPSVEDHFAELSRRRNGPWLAHRLDADTAGCLVIALTKTALIEAQAAFAAGGAEKTYWAIVQGSPRESAGTIDAPLLKQSTPAGWRMVVSQAGQPAVSDWRVLASAVGLSLLEVRPRTGRTHQVRVHCATLDCPVLGDAVYGTGGAMLHLLARAITLPLSPPLSATAPIPAHMQAAASSLAVA